MGQAEDLSVGGAARDVAMARSEEQLLVERVSRPRQRVRLVKHVVTDSVTHTTEVRREELRVEREPIDDDEPAPDPGEQSLEFVLHEEQVVIEKRVVPCERVRVTKEIVTEQRPIAAELRREEIVLEQDSSANATTTESE